MENFDTWVKNRNDFSDDDKSKCKGIICDIVEIALCARKHGLLGILELIKSTDDKFLQNGISLVVDGFQLDEIKEKMQNEIIEGDYKGAELLKRILIYEGVIAIYQANNPIAICNYLSTFFGENYFQLNHK